MKRALFIGRFQPFHNAHLVDIKKVLKEADEVIIAIGSSKEKNTAENPFSYTERKKMIAAVLRGNRIKGCKIYPVPDMHNDGKWVGYIKDNLPRYDFVYSGNLWTLGCFKKFDSEVRKIKLIKGISSTVVRGGIAKGKNWKKLVPEEVIDCIEKINGVRRIKKIYSRT